MFLMGAFKLIVIVALHFPLIGCLEDVSNSVLLDRRGVLAAFGDFNADKHTDIFVISEDGRTVAVHLASSDGAFAHKILLDNKTISDDKVITSVVPADFDGDVQMDLLVTRQKLGDASGPVGVEIYWGLTSSLDPGGPLKLPDMVDQPLMLDANGDMMPDLMGEKSPGERFYWFINESRNISEVRIGNTSLPQLRKPQSSAFVDLDDDLTADACFVSVNENGKPQLEVWLNKNGVLKQDENRTSVVQLEGGADLAIIGQFTFLDFDGDLRVDALAPACEDKACTKSLILAYLRGKWIRLPMGFENSGLTWGFVPDSNTPGSVSMPLPMTLRPGDFNLDGYPDLLATVAVVGSTNDTGEIHRAVILENVECGGACHDSERMFAVEWNSWLEGHTESAIVPAFYDLDDNGVLDIIVSSITENNGPQLTVMKHTFVDDACFVKVTVTSGRCSDNCPKGRQPYGVNQPGPVVRYSTTDLKGDPQQRTATQLSQSAYSPLQLPYQVFGLGQTPNFIDSLEVGIPYPTGKSPRHKEWTAVIPNAQLVIIPYPLDDPDRWINKLFVTPSRLMLLTGAALLGTCGFIAGIVGILHWRDKVEDRKEKRQEAHKFHFDAM